MIRDVRQNPIWRRRSAVLFDYFNLGGGTFDVSIHEIGTVVAK